MTEEELIRNLKSQFVHYTKPDEKGFPETDEVLGTDRIKVIKKWYTCPCFSHLRWEEYYQVLIDGKEYNLFWYPWPERHGIAEIYPGRELGRTIVHITHELETELRKASIESNRFRDCRNSIALKKYYREEYDKYFGDNRRSLSLLIIERGKESRELLTPAKTCNSFDFEG